MSGLGLVLVAAGVLAVVASMLRVDPERPQWGFVAGMALGALLLLAGMVLLIAAASPARAQQPAVPVICKPSAAFEQDVADLLGEALRMEGEAGDHGSAATLYLNRQGGWIFGLHRPDDQVSCAVASGIGMAPRGLLVPKGPTF
jgi:hypothetical protein